MMSINQGKSVSVDSEEAAVKKLELELKQHLFIAGTMAAYLRNENVCDLVLEALSEMDFTAANEFSVAVGKKT